jgi:hypothetical protein
MNENIEFLIPSRDQMSLPEIIYVSGSPLLDRDFNGAYTKVEGEDKWVSKNIFNDMMILKRHNQWILGPIGFGTAVLYTKRSVDQSSPLGEWGDILVTEEKSLKTFWRDNKGIIGFGSLLALTAFFLFY